MKLLECHVDNFGKLSNFDYQFSDGLTVIQEPNGFGKSTLAAFIKAMLYGLQFTINDLSKRMMTIHPNALACYNELILKDEMNGN